MAFPYLDIPAALEQPEDRLAYVIGHIASARAQLQLKLKIGLGRFKSDSRPPLTLAEEVRSVDPREDRVEAISAAVANAETVVEEATRVVETAWALDEQQPGVWVPMLNERPEPGDEPRSEGDLQDLLLRVTRASQRMHFVRFSGGDFWEDAFQSESMERLRDEFRINRNGSTTAYSQLPEDERTPYEAPESP